MPGGTVFLGDLHAPYHDTTAVDATIEVIRRTKPSRIVMLGDIVDFYAISRFCKEPERSLRLQEEIDAAHRVMSLWRAAAPHADIDYIEGNHEERLRKYLWTRAPELSRLRCLDFQMLMGLFRLNIRYHDHGWCRVGGIIAQHGETVRPMAGYTVSGELRKRGCSVIQGHTHRAAHVTRTTMSGDSDGIEAGCLCLCTGDAHDYIRHEGTPDWQQAMVYRGPEDWESPQLIRIHEGRCSLGVQAVEGRARTA